LDKRPEIRKLEEISYVERKEYIRETGFGGMYWIDLAQDRDQWRDLVNTVIDFLVA
jgi:hypothetical protein